MSDDAADVQRVLAGDVDAYAALVDRYYDRCARFAIRMLGNRDDAEDAFRAALSSTPLAGAPIRDVPPSLEDVFIARISGGECIHA